VERARLSGGISEAAIYRMVVRSLEHRHRSGGVLLDVGCGGGKLWPYLRSRFDHYVGCDVVTYDQFPPEGEFVQGDFDAGRLALPDSFADVVAAVETIEHLENPRAFVRELVRVVKPGGWVVITTPNQESVLSLLTLLLKGRFSAFQDVHYPAHLTALLEIDLHRIASESGLTDVSTLFSLTGRVALTPWHYPRLLARLFPSAFSDNVLLIGKKPTRAASQGSAYPELPG
jgi:2-polyprenyl-3-methyl-5-hydroxy-6-metoxy-1,4-benzoquinol methylase